MGQKDLMEKNLEFYPDVFADVVNALMYDGKPLLQEWMLQPAPTETLYRGKAGRMRNQFHDVSKYLMKDAAVRQQYTIENETKVRHRMVLRKAGYMGAVYREQVDRGKVFPVIGMVLYWGKGRWKAPCSMHQLFGDARLQDADREYVDDIKLQVYEMAHLSREVRERFHSDMRIVVDYLAEGGSYLPTNQKIRHPEALLLLLEALTGDSRYSEIIPEMLIQEKEGGSVTMCELIDKYEQRGIQKGMEEGIQKGMKYGMEATVLSSIRNMMKNLKLTAEQAMAVLEIPAEEKQKYLQKLV